MAMFTLLEGCDLRGKRIIPFCTNEGSGMGSSKRDLKRICVGAEIAKGLSIHGAEAAQSEKQVAEFCTKLLKRGGKCTRYERIMTVCEMTH